MKESQIWKDAKFLHVCCVYTYCLPLPGSIEPLLPCSLGQKLAAKEFNKLSGRKDDADDDGSDDDDKKKKAPTAYRLLKTRLQKLVDKKDSTFVLASFPHTVTTYFSTSLIEAEFFRRNSWSCLVAKPGRCITH